MVRTEQLLANAQAIIARSSAMVRMELWQYGGYRPWIARITGPHRKWGLEREFVTGIKDHSRIDEAADAVPVVYLLEDGIYEICRCYDTDDKSRFFIQVEGDAYLTVDPTVVLQRVQEMVRQQQERIYPDIDTLIRRTNEGGFSVN